MNLRINYILHESRANGPGLRYTIWVQGCSIHCPGCSNTDTWDPRGGKDMNVDEIVTDILSRKNLDGVTITGGEPFDQIPAIANLCEKLFGKISIFLTTGYTDEWILKNERMNSSMRRSRKKPLRLRKLLDSLDILCVGPFEADKICSGEWRGSSNQTIWYLTELGQKQAQMPVIPKEFIINQDGTTIETGFTA
jgi:anaerobic ribonucleoside-triphosphate reductase activating protein